MAILEIDTSQLDLDGLSSLGVLPIYRENDRQFIDLPRSAVLYTKGYPRQRGQIDDYLKSLTNKSFITDGRSPRSLDESGLYGAMYFDGETEVKSLDRMCGSPWIVGDCLDENWNHLLAGVHIGGALEGEVERMGIFLGTEVLIQRLNKIK